MASKKASPGDEGNASDFIRAQPVDMTAPEVVDAGKKAGFDFSTSLVYAVRGRMKKSGAPSSRRAEPEAPARRTKADVGGGKLEAQIEALVRAFVQDMSALVRRAALDSVRDALGDR
ncbi:MAG TPA: hypothetical protein VHE30_26170 [Polyangiaceae bacterium]|nr:hypothetical protein [Polyangiaceae bacterium]